MASWFVDFDDYVDPHRIIQDCGLSDPILGNGGLGWRRVDCWRTQFSEMATLGSIHIDADEIVAWREGTVGWIGSRCRITFGDREPQEARMTVIVHEEGVYWKIVHQQFGVTVANEDVVLEPDDRRRRTSCLCTGRVPTGGGRRPTATVTIMFTELKVQLFYGRHSAKSVGWISLSWGSLVVKQKTALFGGTVVRGQGDGFMAVPRRALRRPARAPETGEHPVTVLSRADARKDSACTPAMQAEGGEFFDEPLVAALIWAWPWW